MSGGQAVVTVTDHGSKKVVDASKKKPAIDVGIIGPKANAKHAKGRGKKPTLAAIAGWHEFGTKHIPKRPFIRGWADADRAATLKFLADLSAKLLDGKLSTERMVDLFGLRAVGGIQKFISRKIPPPLALSTVRQRLKRSSAQGAGKRDNGKRDKRGRTRRAKSQASATPLIDTGLLRSSITYRLHRK